MKRKQLQEWMRKYGKAGVFMAAIYLGWRQIRTEVRCALLAGLSGLALIACLVGVFHARPRRSHPQTTSARPPAARVASHHPAADTPPVRHSPDLLAKAIEIADTDDWELPNGTDAQSYMTYYWPSNDRVLYFTSDAYIEERLWQLDVKTGKKTSFPIISKLWSDDGLFKKQIEISPDGQRILWSGNFQDHDYHGYYGARRDGSAKFYLPRKAYPYFTSFKWMPDSRHFIEDTGRYDDKGNGFTHLTTVIRSVDAPQAAMGLSQQEAEIYSDRSTHVLSGNRAIQIQEWPTNRWPPEKYTLEAKILKPQPTLLQRWTIPIPSTEDRSEMKLSPDGRQIAWIVITPSESQKPQRVSLSVSRADGSALQEIGHLTLAAAPADWFGPTFKRYPHEMKWLPDGKHLSFIHENTLYVLPVPFKAGDRSR